MKLYVLDTDVAGFVQSHHQRVTERINSLPDEDTIAVTVVAFGEDLGGWLPSCRRARNGQMRARAYARLQQGLDFYRGMICLPFDDVPAAIFDRLRAHKIRVGTNDLAIAAIVLSVNGILITRNTADFQKVPGLVLEDWTIAI